MKPWKKLSGLMSWLLRISILMFVATHFLPYIQAFNLGLFSFYEAALFALAGLFLVAGGFFNRHSVTIYSAMVLLVLSVYNAFVVFEGITGIFSIWMLMISGSLYFIVNGNK